MKRRPAPRTRSVLALLAACSGAASLPACSSDPTAGYAFAESYDTAIRTVSVPIFQNETFSRGLETTLTDAIVKRIQRHTPYRVVASERADTTLTGTITRTELGVLSDDPQTGLAQEQTYRITVRFTWLDNRTGQSRVVRENFSSTGVFAPAREVGDRIEVGQRDAIDELARDIVESMRGAW
jgi:uncharacterized lipoprotein YmbA